MSRVHVRVEGVVQGVGYRPFVHRLARELGLAGFVRNDARGVEIEAEGRADVLARFVAGLRDDAPPLAVVDAVRAVGVPPRGDAGFAIAGSVGGAPSALVTADAATCHDCLAELRDPGDRRFRYPFVNCTNCGPRFTIVRGVPYDRPLTTMAGFRMCAACQAEYDDPGDRRFHAQPNACPVCGPRVRLVGEAPAGRDAIERAALALRAGAIVAVKGIGGFHLACRADDEDAVARLRARKHREDRPFALMAADVDSARGLVELGPQDVALLALPARPIVLAPRAPDAAVADAVAPGMRELGVMLPYAPLHHLLLGDAGVPLVLTSGNVSDEPIAFRDDDALQRLSGIADLVAVHDRPIHTRVDDSVARVVAGRTTVLRRARGIVPAAIALPVPSARPVLACGAELKSTFCVARGARAWVGHHIGDLRNAETLASFTEGIAHFQRLFDVRPQVVAHDLHPEYLSTAYALERDGVELVGVQHHHAHLAACLAEHGLTARAAGAIYDGTGHGTDGTAWGGEILLGDLRSCERIGHLPPVRLPGGDRAVREPWRMACAWLVAAHGDVPEVPPALRAEVDPERWEAVARMALSGFAAPQTTSMGRLFDAVAALCGVRSVVTYEGQAAIELEACADTTSHEAYTGDAHAWIDAVAADAATGVPAPVISARFHRAVADWTAAACAAAGTEARRPVRRRLPEPAAAHVDRRAAGAAGPHRPLPRASPRQRRRDLLRAGGDRGSADGLIRGARIASNLPRAPHGCPGQIRSAHRGAGGAAARRRLTRAVACDRRHATPDRRTAGWRPAAPDAPGRLRRRAPPGHRRRAVARCRPGVRRGRDAQPSQRRRPPGAHPRRSPPRGDDVPRAAARRHRAPSSDALAGGPHDSARHRGHLGRADARRSRPCPPRRRVGASRTRGAVPRVVARRQIRDAMTRRPSTRLKAYLGDVAPTQSTLEDRFLRLCARHRIPRPLAQQGRRPRLDFVWPEQRVVVEVDGWEAHRTRARSSTTARRRTRCSSPAMSCCASRGRT